MSALTVIGVLLREDPWPGLACCVTLTASGTTSLASAVVDTVRIVRGRVHQVAEQPQYDQEFDAIISAEPDLQDIGLDPRLRAGRRWMRGGPGRAEVIVTCCTRPLLVPAYVLNAALRAWGKVRAVTARRRGRENR